jgi:hypothetical protein
LRGDAVGAVGRVIVGQLLLRLPRLRRLVPPFPHFPNEPAAHLLGAGVRGVPALEPAIVRGDVRANSSAPAPSLSLMRSIDALSKP